jgi:hypothetical protein
MINVVQNSTGSNTDTMVSFGLVTSSDVAETCAVAPNGTICQATTNGGGNDQGGLIMSNLNGAYHPVNNPHPVTDSVSVGGGALNLLERTDSQLNEWEEYWITLGNNGGKAGNIEANIYMNGSLIPDVFQLTLAGGNNAAYAKSNDPFLEFGFSDNGGFGSLDLDFLSYKIGIHAPVAALANLETAIVPEPSSVLLWAMGFTGLYGSFTGLYGSCTGLYGKRRRRSGL